MSDTQTKPRKNKLTLNRPKQNSEEIPLTKIDSVIYRKMSAKHLKPTPGPKEVVTPQKTKVMKPVIVELDVPEESDIMVIEESVLVKNKDEEYKLLYDAGGNPLNKVRPSSKH